MSVILTGLIGPCYTEETLSVTVREGVKSGLEGSCCIMSAQGAFKWPRKRLARFRVELETAAAALLFLLSVRCLSLTADPRVLRLAQTARSTPLARGLTWPGRRESAGGCRSR